MCVTHISMGSNWKGWISFLLIYVHIFTNFISQMEDNQFLGVLLCATDAADISVKNPNIFLCLAGALWQSEERVGKWLTSFLKC